MTPRLNFLDNLRTFIIFIVIVYHAGFVYQWSLANNWLVVDPVKIDSLGLVGMYLNTFVMYILFFISGYFIPKSVKNKSTWEFLKSKFKRIYLPWLIAVFTLIPAYKAIFLHSRGLPQEEWYSYFHFFKRAGSNLSLFSNDLSQNWLWFLPILFLFQILYLVLSKSKLSSVDISLKMGVLLTFVIGVIYSMIISIVGLKGWTLTALLDFQNERLLVYFIVFLLGALCYKHDVFNTEERSKKYIAIFNIILWIALTIFTIVALNLFFNLIDPARNFYFISRTIDRLFYYSTEIITMISFIYIFVDLFKFNIKSSGKIWTELNKNSYYVYIIHMIVIGLIALILVPMVIPTILKYFILIIFTFIVSNLLVSITRWIFSRK